MTNSLAGHAHPTLLVLQHLDLGGPGLAEPVLLEAGLTLDVRRMDRGDPLPTDGEVEAAAGVLVLGGPQAAYSDDGFPTRRAELSLIGAALGAGIPYLGICLGAQLLAAAAGGRCYRGTVSEIGWTDVTLTDDAASDPLWADQPRRLRVMESHLDHYDLPADAVTLATGDRYPYQAFRVADCAWGLQFHLEAGDDFAATRRRFVVPGWEQAPDADQSGADDVDDDAAGVRHLALTARAVFGRFAQLALVHATEGHAPVAISA